MTWSFIDKTVHTLYWLFVKSQDQITEALKARSLQSFLQALTGVIIVVHGTAQDSHFNSSIERSCFYFGAQ